MKQTAVEFLHSEYKRIFGDVLVKPSQGIEISDALSQAKEIEKEQIIDAYQKGYRNGGDNFGYGNKTKPIEYYNETYEKL